MNSVSLFHKDMNNICCFRIPSLLYTRSGRLLAVVDARPYDGHDNPNCIDKVLRYSDDEGQTWSDCISIVKMPGDSRENGAAAVDACMVQEESGRIYMIYCCSPAGIGLRNAYKGTGRDSENNLLLYDDNNAPFTVVNNRFSDKDIEYFISVNGDIECNGHIIGNCFLNNSPYRIWPTCYLYLIHSDDDGITWSEPFDISPQVKEDWMKFIGPGPGVGIQLKSGIHTGRLVLPVYYSNEHEILSSAVIYSDDGIVWQRGGSPNDLRCDVGSEKLDDELFSLQEMQVVETSGGNLLAYIRNTMPEKVVYVAESHDCGESWCSLKPCCFLDNPVCMISAISLKQNGDCVMISTPLDKEQRINGAVILSDDCGNTPGKILKISENGFAYSCLTQISEDTFGILYEIDDGTPCTPEICFSSFSIDEMTQFQ